MNQLVNSNPSVIARETLKQLALLKIPPTPDSYHKFYDQIAGNPDNQISAATAKMLAELAKEFPRHTTSLLNCANSLEQAVNEKNWLKFKGALLKLLVTQSLTVEGTPPPVNAKHKLALDWGDVIRSLIKELGTQSKKTSDVAKKRKSIKQILDEHSDNPELLYANLSGLIQSWKTPVHSLDQNDIADTRTIDDVSVDLVVQESRPNDDILAQEYEISGYTGQLLELLAQVLEGIVANQLDDEVLADEAKLLAYEVKKVQNKLGMEQFMAAFQQFCDKYNAQEDGRMNVQQGLLRLLSLLMESTGELLSEDRWIKSQLSKLKKAMSNPLDMRIIEQAETSLEKILRRQVLVKEKLGKTRETMKQVVTSLISNLEELSDATGGYNEQLEYYSEKIKQVDDIDGLNKLLAEIMQETQKVQKRVLSHRNDLLAARAEINSAQDQINQLEAQLHEMNEKVQEDHLTGALNRRGLDNAYRREVSHLNHAQGPLCFALLDIDNFKQLNDTHGHHVGDDALIYLVEAVKETVRREDVVSRYGGEEFAILLPNTELHQAVSTIARIRRYLTKKFFLHGNNRLLITFSAGVAQYQAGESQESLFERADEALYRAKKNGKNQIVTAEEKVIPDLNYSI